MDQLIKMGGLGLVHWLLDYNNNNVPISMWHRYDALYLVASALCLKKRPTFDLL